MQVAALVQYVMNINKTSCFFLYLNRSYDRCWYAKNVFCVLNYYYDALHYDSKNNRLAQIISSEKNSVVSRLSNKRYVTSVFAKIRTAWGSTEDVTKGVSSIENWQWNHASGTSRKARRWGLQGTREKRTERQRRSNSPCTYTQSHCVS